MFKVEIQQLRLSDLRLSDIPLYVAKAYTVDNFVMRFLAHLVNLKSVVQ